MTGDTEFTSAVFFGILCAVWYPVQKLLFCIYFLILNTVLDYNNMYYHKRNCSNVPNYIKQGPS
jgi:hypothetical protein